MSSESIHIAQFVECPARMLYEFASDPANVPAWAAGLGGSIEQRDGRWIADAPMGRVAVDFTPPNDYGVLDHIVELPDGTRVLNPMRVIPDGEDRCEVVFTLRRADGVTDDAFAQDEAAIRNDLRTLRSLMVS